MRKYLIYTLTVSLLVLLVIVCIQKEKLEQTIAFQENVMEKLEQTIALQESAMETYRDDIHAYLDKISKYENLKIEETSFSSYREALEKTSMLSFMRVEQIEDLCILTFAVKGLEEEEYHLILQGTWEGKEINPQHLVIPSTGLSDSFENYEIKSQDINFDGIKDLLIHEGRSGGSGGSWDNYRGVIWDEEKFAWYPSFPKQLNCLEFYRKRLIAYGQCGIFDQWIKVYEMVHGEYALSRELRYILRTDDHDSLYYCEMGNLVQEHDITGGYEEIMGLYPDLCYWKNQ